MPDRTSFVGLSIGVLLGAAACALLLRAAIAPAAAAPPTFHVERLPPFEHALPPPIPAPEPTPSWADDPPPPAWPPPPSPEERHAALLLARYGGHEADLEAPAELLLIWQAAESHGETLEERVRWLQRHSRCVVADPPRVRPRRRCRRYRALGWAALEPPEWPAGIAWRPEPWRAYLALALEVVTGREHRRPCDAPIDTWDGRTWREERLAEGYTEVTCRDPWTGEPTLNVGFRFPHWRRVREIQRQRALLAPSEPPAPETMVRTPEPDASPRAF